jgi:hypothetical protein
MTNLARVLAGGHGDINVADESDEARAGSVFRS